MLEAESITSAGSGQLVGAAVAGIAVVVLLIAWAKWHPFLALIVGAATLGLVAGAAPGDTVDSFVAGVGSTAGGVGMLIALGSMIGALLAESGGADGIVSGIVRRVSGSALPWAMAGVAALVGLPLFFEVGVVLLVPIVLLAARRTGVSLLKIGIPALAGLSVLHGLVPPHPGPLVAIDSLGADLGLTLGLGLIAAVPTVIVAGPVLGSFLARWVPVAVPDRPATGGSAGGPAGGATGRSAEGPAGEGSGKAEGGATGKATGGARGKGEGDLAGEGSGNGAGGATGRAEGGATGKAAGVATGKAEGGATGKAAGGAGGAGGEGSGRVAVVEGRRGPSIGAAVATVLLPIVLMLLRAVAELTLAEGGSVRGVAEVLGEPVVALLCGVLLAMWTLGRGAGFGRARTAEVLGGALPPVAGILLIVAAGGGFKQVLVDAGVGDVVAQGAQDAHVPALLLGFLVAVGIRVATGSATVATITAAGIVAPLAGTLERPEVSLLALAIGCGSLALSHVNDAGFWLVKEYFGMTVGQTVKTWSVMETVISVVGFGCVLLLDLVV